MNRQVYHKIINGLMIIVLVFCFTNCSKTKDNNDVNNIITACIKETIGAGDAAKMAYRFSLPNLPDTLPDAEGINKILKKEYDSAKAVLDTAYSYIVLNDTLIAPNNRFISEVGYGLQKFKEEKVETDFIKWDKAEKQIVDLKNISQQVQLNIEKKWPKKPDAIRNIGSFYFSSIVFNKTKDRSAVYEQYFCGDRCGFEILMILEKRNDAWIVVNKAQIGTF